MDDRDTSILTQVAFKEAGECARAERLDLTSSDGQARFELIFNYLVDSLTTGVRSQLGERDRAAELIKAAFPGTQDVTPQGWGQQQGSVAPHQHSFNPQPQWGQQASQAFTPAVMPQQGGSFVGPHNYQLTVKGQQHGELPQWLYERAARDGVHEVYDNRDQPPGSRRPLFKSTQGGRDAPAYWGPEQ